MFYYCCITRKLSYIEAAPMYRLMSLPVKTFLTMLVSEFQTVNFFHLFFETSVLDTILRFT